MVSCFLYCYLVSVEILCFDVEQGNFISCDDKNKENSA